MLKEPLLFMFEGLRADLVLLQSYATKASHQPSHSSCPNVQAL